MSARVTSWHEATRVNARYDWLHFVARSGEEAHRWVEEFSRYAELMRWNAESLALLRRRRYEAGHEVLLRMEERLGEIGNGNGNGCASINYVLRRWYCALLAYYHYCMEDFDRAGQSLDQAQEAVVRGIETRRFLLPLATDCVDFALQRVRIARNRRRWREMRNNADRARAMMGGREPFCVLADGTPIGWAELARFYHSLSPLAAEEREALRGLLDDELRLDLVDRFIVGIYALPGMVIPYP